MCGSIQIVFVGVFSNVTSQKKANFENNTMHFAAINNVVFKNISHRFEEDLAFGEIMRRLRIRQVTRHDTQTINTRFVENNNIYLLLITKLRYSCYMNDERNT